MRAIQDAITRLATCGDVSDVKTADLADAELEAMREVIEEDAVLLKHIKDILIGRGFTDPLVQEIQAHFINRAAVLGKLEVTK